MKEDVEMKNVIVSSYSPDGGNFEIEGSKRLLEDMDMSVEAIENPEPFKSSCFGENQGNSSW